jgi:hypothetical protein
MYMQITVDTAWRAFPTEAGKKQKVMATDKDSIPRRLVARSIWHEVMDAMERESPTVDIEPCEQATTIRQRQSKRQKQGDNPAGPRRGRGGPAAGGGTDRGREGADADQDRPGKVDTG